MEVVTKVLDQDHGDTWTLYHGDSCELLKGLPDASVGLTVTSVPFGNLYIYSESANDLGNSGDHEEFGEHYRYLVGELLRVTKPGRLCAVHCKDLPLYKNRDGSMGLYPFPDLLVRVHLDAGWIMHSRVTIWKDPVTEMQRTKNHGLLYKELAKDSCGSRQGMADYLLVFRAWTGEFCDPVNAGSAGWERFDHYVGTEPPDPTTIADEFSFMRPVADRWGRWPKRNPFPPDSEAYRIWSIKVWQKYASPVWFDIDQMDTLNEKVATESSDEKHICVARGSLVLTRDGHIPIEDVEVGDMVLTHRGRWRPVIAKVCNGVKSVVQVHAHGVPYLRVTPDHNLWTRYNGGGNPGSHRRSAMKGEPVWMPAVDTLGSYVNLGLPPIEESPMGPLLSTHDWWVIGRWLGDGHWDTRDGIHISCSRGELDELISLLGDRAGLVHDPGTACQIRIKDPDGRLRNLLRRCGRKAHDKRLPVEALSLNREMSESLLSGYLSADGCFSPRSRNGSPKWSGTSVSRSLLLGLAMVAQRAHGAVWSVYAGRVARTCVIQGRTVNAKSEWKFNCTVDQENPSAFLDNHGSWKKVRGIELCGEAEVWDLQVDEDQSFTVEGCVVHNCPLQLCLIERCIHLWSNPGDVILDPFNGIGSTGGVAIEQRRRYVGCELKKSYFDYSSKHLRIIEEDMSRATLFDLMEDADTPVSADAVPAE